MIFSKKIINLIVSFFINVSSTYFVAAALTPTTAIGSTLSKSFNFSLNIISAIIYFILAVKTSSFYE